jgi:hypothetical protein
VSQETANMKPKKLRKVGRVRFTDGVERDVFANAEGRQFVEDDGELVAGEWLPPADEPAIAEHP